MFKLVVITLPCGVEGEAETLSRLAANPAIHGIHLRKPSFTENEMRSFLGSLPDRVLHKSRIHTHYGLIMEFPLQGLHLTSHSFLPAGYKGAFSASCHGLGEVKRKLQEGCDYVFLSPIFDSISKPGYKAAFSEKDLRSADLSRVVALGGATPEKIPLLKEIGFDGVALCGAVWRAGGPPAAEDMRFAHEF